MTIFLLKLNMKIIITNIVEGKSNVAVCNNVKK